MAKDKVILLGELFTWVKGKKPKKILDQESDNALPYLTAAYVRSKKLEGFVKKEDRSCIFVEQDDVLLIWDGSNAGDVFHGFKGALSSTMVKFNKSDKCDGTFLFYLLKSNFSRLNQNTTGSTIPHVNSSVLKAIQLPIEDVIQQKAIAHILSTIQETITVQEELTVKLKELQQSMMYELFVKGTKSAKIKKMVGAGEIVGKDGMNNDAKIKLGIETAIGDASVKAHVEGDQKAVVSFFSKIIPEFLKDGIGMINDQFKSWRLSNFINIAQRAKKKIESSGLKMEQIPTRYWHDILEKSSLAENINMQEKWANLIANAITGNREITLNYIAILNEISPKESLILDEIFSISATEPDYLKRKKMQFSAEILRKKLSIPEEKMDLLVDNLFRLNLLQSPAGEGIKVGNYPYALRTSKIFELTTLGYEFVRACKWETKNK